MEQLLVVGNPARRSRRRKSARRSKRARRSLSPLQRMYFGGGASRNPSKRRSRRRAAPASRRRRSRRSGSSVGRYSINSALRSPISTLKPALVGAAGAIAVNTIMGRLVPMIPGAATLLGGRMRYVTQIGAALALAAVASKLRFIGSATAAKMAEGALTVTMVDVLRDAGSQVGVNLGGMGYYLPGYGVTGAVAPVPSGSARPARMAGMGKYLTGPGAGSVVPFRRSSMAGAPYGRAGAGFGF